MKGDGQTNSGRPERPRFERWHPEPRLRPFVRNYWALQTAYVGGMRRRQRITPDGCIDILFVRRRLTEDFKALVVGTMTRPVFEELTGPAEYWGIRFAPGGFTAFFRTPTDELTDRIVPLDDLCAKSVVATRLATAPDAPTRLQVLEETLRQWLLLEKPDPILTRVLETVSARQGAVTVEQLARTAGWSSRHLHRVICRSVGVGPKTFCRIMRFKSALRALRCGSPADLLRVALEAGYYDQAHFIHDFNFFYGASPSTVFADPTF